MEKAFPSLEGAHAVHQPAYVDVAVWTWLPEVDGMGILALDDSGHIFRGSVSVPLPRDHANVESGRPWEPVTIPAGVRATAISIVNNFRGERRYVTTAGGQVYVSQAIHEDDISWRQLSFPGTVIDIIATDSLYSSTIYALDSAGQIRYTRSDLEWNWSRWSPINPPPGRAEMIAAAEQFDQQIAPAHPNLLVTVTADGDIYQLEHAVGSNDGNIAVGWTPRPPPDDAI